MPLKVCSCDIQGRFQCCCVYHVANIVHNSGDLWPVKYWITQIYRKHFSCNTLREACKTLQFVSEMPKNNFWLLNRCCIRTKRAFARRLGKPSLGLLLAQGSSG